MPRRERPNEEGRGLREQLRDAIRESGESLQGLGRRTGVGADRLSRFVRGERGLSLEAAEKLCLALGLRLARAAGAGRKRRGKGE